MYETAPQLEDGQASQPNYINAVIKIRTYTELEYLLEDLQFIENIGACWAEENLAAWKLMF